MKTGMFIVLEGIDGSGKTTQARNLYEALLLKGYATLLTWEPGGTKLGDMVANWLRTTPIRSARTELFLLSGARSHHLDEIIRPALGEGKIVICDRFTHSTIAYQGHGRHMDLCIIKMVNLQSTNSLKPDLTFLIDVPTEVASRRNAGKEKDVWEAEEFHFHERVRKGYLEQAKDPRNQLITIDGSSTPNVISNEIWTHVESLITHLNITPTFDR